MTEVTHPPWAEHVPHAIVAFGVGSLALNIAMEAVFVGPRNLLTPSSLLLNGVTLAFTATIVVAGLWLLRGEVGVRRYPRVARWTVGFAVVFTVANLLIMVVFPGGTLFGLLSWALWALYVGAAGGVTVGTFEARAIGRAVEAEREAVHAEHVEAQRTWLDYLNSLLRHEVLNNATIIQGYASLLLEEDLDAEHREPLEHIHHQSQDMTDVVRDVRVLIQATDAAEAFEPLDLRTVLEEELSDLRTASPEVETDLTVDGRPTVDADGLLPRAFSNLLSNAVEHNPVSEPQVDVTVESDGGWVRVAVTDNGPGVPDSERTDLFGRGGGDHGLGLYLVRVLVERYGGAVDLAATGPDGSEFVVELPLAGGERSVDPDPGPEADAESDRLVPSGAG